MGHKHEPYAPPQQKAAEDAPGAALDEATSSAQSTPGQTTEGEEMNEEQEPSTPQPAAGDGDSSGLVDDQAQSHSASPVSGSVSDTGASGWMWTLRLAIKSVVALTVGATLLVLLGLAQRFDWITADGFSGGALQTTASATAGGEAKRYICPMMCTPPSSEPGRCPVCGMELVEATGGGGAGDAISVDIEPAARRLVGIQTATSKSEAVTRTVRTVGSIDFDESKLATISAYTDGRLEELYADYVGVRVAKGDDLALIYSPKLYSAQAEFLSAVERESKPSGRFSLNLGNLAEMARENLTELGMTDAQIEALGNQGKADSRIRIKSPQAGTVIERKAVEGDYVKTGQTLFRVADLSSVWLMLDLFPDDASAVRFGQQVEAEIQSLPGQVFTGRVAFIDPTVDPQTRTVRVRVEMSNFDRLLKPGDYATARITVPAVPTDKIYDPALAGKYISPMHPQVIRDEPGSCPLCGMELVPTEKYGYARTPLPDQHVVTVPRDALLMTGDNSVVYVETDPGRFEIRRVTAGLVSDNKAVIVEGLAAGETIATQGSFLIDSQMQLAGNPSLIDPTGAPRFSPGPLELPSRDPVLLAGDTAEQFDQAYAAYFVMQRSLASDQTPPTTAVNGLVQRLLALETATDVPDEAQQQFAIARRRVERMGESLESTRKTFRVVSHALLKAATFARGTETARQLVHFHCPMVPGGGGDWMQPTGELANPYWGHEMLRCGEPVADLAIGRKADATIADAAN